MTMNGDAHVPWRDEVAETLFRSGTFLGGLFADKKTRQRPAPLL
jgi:hypothetical protein